MKIGSFNNYQLPGNYQGLSCEIVLHNAKLQLRERIGFIFLKIVVGNVLKLMKYVRCTIIKYVYWI